MKENLSPKEIEKKSFEIIDMELQKLGKNLEIDNELVIKRAIHTSADFSYAENLIFSKDVVKKSVKIFKNGCTIITDTNMVKSGINKIACEKLGIEVKCFIADEDIVQEAKKNNSTRATESMIKSKQFDGNLIFAIGNAPTALIKLDEMIKNNEINPKLIIGVPVGFVNVVESKELIMQNEKIDFIVARGRKGGSNIAASIVNAILYQATNRE